MRSLKSIYTIPAHKSAISDLKFFHSTPTSTPSSIPSTAVPRAFSKLPIFADGLRDPLEVDGQKVDMPLSGSFLVSGGYDGMIKIWSADDWQLVKSMTSDAAGKVMSVDVSSGEFHSPPRVPLCVADDGWGGRCSVLSEWRVQQDLQAVEYSGCGPVVASAVVQSRFLPHSIVLPHPRSRVRPRTS
jgi:hypothetical protein